MELYVVITLCRSLFPHQSSLTPFREQFRSFEPRANAITGACSLPLPDTAVTALAMDGTVVLAGLATGAGIAWQLHAGSTFAWPDVEARPVASLRNGATRPVQAVGVSSSCDVGALAASNGIWVRGPCLLVVLRWRASRCTNTCAYYGYRCMSCHAGVLCTACLHRVPSAWSWPKMPASLPMLRT